MPAAHPESFSRTSHVRYDECGAGGTARASVYLRLLQELAFAHSAVLGFSLAWYEKQRLFWLVRRIHLVVETPARHGDALVYTTRILGARRILARRLGTVHREDDGAPVAAAAVDWVLTRDGTTPVRVPQEMAAAFPDLGRAVTPLPLEEPPASPDAAPSPLWVRVSDADPMGHTNHAVYLDLLEDAAVRAGAGAAVEAHPRTYDLQYHTAAAPGAALRDLAWPGIGCWHYRLERPGGSLVLHGRLMPTA